MTRSSHALNKANLRAAPIPKHSWWDSPLAAWGVMSFVVLTMFAIYWPVSSHEFVNYDDGLYVFDNPVVKHGMTWPGVQWAFTTLQVSNWHPLTWLSHMLDVEWFGLKDPGKHHLVNVFIHAANTVLLFALLVRLTGLRWRSVLVAALFCLHPLRVESVAWVAERKDVLSTLFGLLAVWWYAGYAARRDWMHYALTVICFAMSLMAKPMLVTLPCILLLLDVWPLRRWNKAGGDRNALQLIAEKIPLFAMAIASCWVTVYAQNLGGSISPLEHIDIDQRLQNAVVAYAAYIAKFIWPANLAVLYPHPGQWEWWRVAVSAVSLVGISGTVVLMRRKKPALLTGWLWFLGTLVPVIGLVQVGLQSMADRYTYVPHIGLSIMLAWSVPALNRRAFVVMTGAACVVGFMLLCWATSRQLRHWRDSVSLFEHTIAVTSRNYIAEHNLAKGWEEQGNVDRAIEHYQKALGINPDYPSAHNNLGLLLSARDAGESVRHLRRAAELSPHSSVIRSNLGLALEYAGLVQEAEAELRKAVELNPRDGQAHLNLARFLHKQKRFDEAIDSFIASLLINPDVAEAHCDLGDSLAYLGEFDRAIAHFEAALQLKPDFERARLLRNKAKQVQRELQQNSSN
jgi:protein O-mannosyl-transferase